MYLPFEKFQGGGMVLPDKSIRYCQPVFWIKIKRKVSRTHEEETVLYLFRP